MASKTDIRIYIDNAGHGDDKVIGGLIKDRILGLKIDARCEVKTFSDLDEATIEDSDPDNEENTLEAITKANIVIPIISSSYARYATARTNSAINGVINSVNRYLFPVLLDHTDWSDHDWIVKSQITPRDAKPLSFFSENDKEKIVNELASNIKAVILNIIASNKTERVIFSSEVLKNRKAIFISHDHDDADFAELLKLKLEKEGIISWLDTERLKIGQDWREEIDLGIEDSVAVIVVMTPEARKSEYVTYEWAFAWGKNKKIFPLMLKQTQLHPRLESLQYLNFTYNPTRPWEELIDSIKKVMEE